jgi:hypothetical protein
MWSGSGSSKNTHQHSLPFAPFAVIDQVQAAPQLGLAEVEEGVEVEVEIQFDLAKAGNEA